MRVELYSGDVKSVDFCCMRSPVSRLSVYKHIWYGTKFYETRKNKEKESATRGNFLFMGVVGYRRKFSESDSPEWEFIRDQDSSISRGGERILL